MSRRTLAMTGALCLTLLALAAAARTPARAAGPDWAANMTVIEACSCPMFCQCYFNTKPAGHGGHAGHGGARRSTSAAPTTPTRSTRATTATTNLDGAKFWVAGDLGGDFSANGEMDWAVLHFDKPLTPGAARRRSRRIARPALPGEVEVVQDRRGARSTSGSSPRTSAVALLDGGKTGEVMLKAFPGMTDEPVVIKNLHVLGRAPQRRLRADAERGRGLPRGRRTPSSSRARTAS